MSDPFSDAAITAALGRHMTQAVQRQAAAVGNIANLDTPGYRTKEVRFADALDDQLAASGLVASDPRHLGGPRPGVADVRSEVTEVQGLASRRDGSFWRDASADPAKPMFDRKRSDSSICRICSGREPTDTASSGVTATMNCP